MTPRFAYMQPNGTVAIVNAAPKESLERVLGPLTREEYEAHVIERSSLDGSVTLTRLPDDWTPPDIDRKYRNAWVMDGAGKTSVDMPRARDIHREHLRRIREPKLAALDLAYMRADELGDQQTKRDIAAQKQALRDVTSDPAIEAAKTPDELRQVLPVALR